MILQGKGLKTNGTLITEVHDIANLNSLCGAKGEPFSKALLRPHVGLVYNSVPLVCGGHLNDSEASNECLIVGDAKPVAYLKEKRFNAASVIVNHGTTLWLTGGSVKDDNGNLTAILQTEYVVILNPVNVGKEAPVWTQPYNNHCLAKVSDSDAFVFPNFFFELICGTVIDKAQASKRFHLAIVGQ